MRLFFIAVKAYFLFGAWVTNQVEKAMTEETKDGI